MAVQEVSEDGRVAPKALNLLAIPLRLAGLQDASGDEIAEPTMQVVHRTRPSGTP